MYVHVCDCLLSHRDVTDAASGSLEGADEIAVLDSGTDWDNEDQVVSELTLVGIVGIEDPVRPEVSQCTCCLGNQPIGHLGIVHVHKII